MKFRSLFGRTAWFVLASSAVALGQGNQPQPDAYHIMRRLGFGPSAWEANLYGQVGWGSYLDYQLQGVQFSTPRLLSLVQQLTLPDAPGPAVEQLAHGSSTEEVSKHLIAQAVYGPAQLREALTHFWEYHFSTYPLEVASFIEKLSMTDHTTEQARTVAAYLEWAELDAFRSMGLGATTPDMVTFDDLLWASATSPAMLAYLDQAKSDKNGPNQNYARELLELHTVGAFGHEQEDVEELSVLLTGMEIGRFPRGSAEDPLASNAAFQDLTLWGDLDSSGVVDSDDADDMQLILDLFTPNPPQNIIDFYDVNGDGALDGRDLQTVKDRAGTQSFHFRFRFNYADHPSVGVTVLGQDFNDDPAIDTPQEALDEVRSFFDFLAGHPKTAGIVCAKLINHFVTPVDKDAPLPAHVVPLHTAMVAQWGARGEIQAVLREMFESDLFEDSIGERTATPFEAAMSGLRWIQPSSTSQGSLTTAHQLEIIRERIADDIAFGWDVNESPDGPQVNVPLRGSRMTALFQLNVDYFDTSLGTQGLNMIHVWPTMVDPVQELLTLCHGSRFTAHDAQLVSDYSLTQSGDVRSAISRMASSLPYTYLY